MFKRILLLAAALLGLATPLYAAEPTSVIETIGGERPIQLKAVKVQGHLAGTWAQTQYELTFFNPNPRALEGQLHFPLLSGQQISGFALDFGQEFRPAVPVEKSKGRQVFEETIRQKVDPALLENTGGNQFRLRIYPVPAQGERRVRVTVSELLPSGAGGATYRLPLNFAKTVPDFALSINAEGLESAPLALNNIGALPFDQDHGVFRANTRKLALNPQGELALQLKPSTKPQVYTQTFKGDTYFLATQPIHLPKGSRITPPAVVGLLWDSSDSGKNRKIAQELALLDVYFKQIGNTEVHLQRLRNIAEPRETFKVINGNWGTLRQALQNTIYDGASSLDFQPEAAVTDYLLFSDGQINYGSKHFPALAAQQKLQVIISAAGTDTDRLAALAAAHHGQLIDLGQGVAKASQTLLTQPPHFLGETGRLSSQGIDQLVTSNLANGDTLLIAGRLTDSTGTLSGQYTNASGPSYPIRITIQKQKIENPMVAQQWARLQIGQLNGEYEINRGAIRRLGLKMALPTRETSLIVLDQVEDYVRHNIEPPASLKSRFDQLIGQKQAQQTNRRQKQIESIVAQFNSRIAWWEKDFPKNTPPKPEKQIKAEELRRQRAPSMAAPMPAPAAEMAAQPSVSRPAAPVAAKAMLADNLAKDKAAEPQIGITLKKWTPDTPYLKRLKATTDQDLYRVYLDEKPSWSNSSAFYLDVADLFAERGQKALALRILSNLAEMDLENRQILRLLGYRLLQMHEAQAAIPVLQEVQRLAEEEPQSYRDLGLAYAANGQNQEAINQFNEVITRPWDGRFSEIELVTLGELNALLAAHPELNKQQLDPRLIRNLPLDVRVVLTWDADNSDMDLWVTDPNGEKCFYGHRDTYQGGHMSRDFTGGYGPEEFLLKKAKPGHYKIEANFFGNRQQVVAGATTLQLGLFTHFGTAKQQEQNITLRLQDAKDTVYVGEFEVK